MRSFVDNDLLRRLIFPLDDYCIARMADRLYGMSDKECQATLDVLERSVPEFAKLVSSMVNEWHYEDSTRYQEDQEDDWEDYWEDEDPYPEPEPEPDPEPEEPKPFADWNEPDADDKKAYVQDWYAEAVW